MKMKKKILLAAALLSLAPIVSVGAATDCIYSADYTFYRGFEGLSLKSAGVYWKAWGNESFSEVISDNTYEGDRAMKFSGRLIYQTDTPTWSFRKGDVIELSGYFRSDSQATVKLQNASNSSAVMAETAAVGTDWTYLSGRYIIESDGETFTPLISAAVSNGEYVYCDNLSVRRVLQTGTNPNIKKIDTHNNVYAAIDKDNTLWLWGEDENYILNETNTPADVPTKKMTNVADVSIGESHIVVLRTDGTVWTWGTNDFGELGNGTTSDVKNPQKIATNCREIAAGNKFTVIIKKNGALMGCGRRDTGQWTASDGVLITTPQNVVIKNYYPVDRVIATDACTYIRICTGDFFTIGYNGNGQLGLGDFLPRFQYTETMNGILDISASDNYAFVTMRDGKLYGMGFGDYGQLGLDTVLSKTPKLLGENVKSAAAGKYSSYITSSDGTVSVWGDKTAGLANASDNVSAKSYGINSVAVAADTDTMCVTADGTLFVNGEEVTIVPKSEEVTPTPEEKPIEKTEYGLSFAKDGKLLYSFDKTAYKKAALVIGGYKEGRLIDVQAVEFDDSSLTTYTIPTIDGADTYKVMLWRDLDSIKPLENVNLIKLAEVAITTDEYNGEFLMTVSGTATSVNGKYSDETVITVLASSEEVPSQENIYHMDQFSVGSTGTFTKTIHIKTNPKDTYVYVRVSDEKIKNLIN